MVTEHKFSTAYDNGEEPKNYRVYVCKRCGGALLALSLSPRVEVDELYPTPEIANINLPGKVRYFLDQAMRSVATPAASLVMSASAIDAMLKEHGRDQGALYTRIEVAVNDGLLTKEMGVWAHQIRLEANSQRHADMDDDEPSMKDAKLSIEFAKTLGDLLFVIPARVIRGISNSSSQPAKKAPTGIQPVDLSLPQANKSASYLHKFNLNNSETKPIVKAKIYYTTVGPILPENLQPEELVVANRPGNPKWWEAMLFLPDLSAYPNTPFIKIFVDDEVHFTGHMNISHNAPKK